ncbi:hypothetical protein AHF37_12102 [Paragonimus kellicotti]|nr:hypothetical protein AHF37_12102 [Paragonimus kellicotti]
MPTEQHWSVRTYLKIICCEGNGGYPEIGTPLVPLDLGYSVLAWNHPGFGSSTVRQSFPFLLIFSSLNHINST